MAKIIKPMKPKWWTVSTGGDLEKDKATIDTQNIFRNPFVTRIKENCLEVQGDKRTLFQARSLLIGRPYEMSWGDSTTKGYSS